MRSGRTKKMVCSILGGKLYHLRSRMSVCFAALLVFSLRMILIQNLTTWNMFSQRSLRQNAARDRVFQECRKFTRNETIDKRSLYYYLDLDKNKSLIWCKVPKAGSTSLVRMFLRLAGVAEVENDGTMHVKLRELYPKLTDLELTTKLNPTVKFLVVRHPFERLLSAYRDKLEDYNRDPQFSAYGNPMVKRLGVNGTIVEPTFPEFVKYLLESSPETYNVHWRPISLICAPCTIHYDVVVKMENFDEEIKLPLGQAGIHEYVGWARSTGTNLKTIERYFQQLSFTQLHQLYHVYRKDFLLFGYTPDKYFAIAVQGNSSFAPTLLQSGRQ